MKRIVVFAVILVMVLAGGAQAAPSYIYSTTARQYMAATGSLNALISEGHVHLYEGTAPGPNAAPNGTKLSDHTLPASGSNSVANGVITVGTVANVNASASGTAQYGRILQSDNSTVIAEFNVGTSGATVTINTTAITSGGPVAITGMTITVPAGS